MNDVTREVVREVLARYGDLETEEALEDGVLPGLLAEPRRLEAYLRDLLPADPLEVAVLVEAVDCGVVTRVFGHDPGAIDDDLRQQMTNVLCEGSGIAPRFAVWAVDSWIAILHGVQDTGREVRKRARPAREVKWSVADRHGTLEAVFSRALEIGGRSATASPEEGPVVRDD